MKMVAPDKTLTDTGDEPAANEVSIRELLKDWADAHRVKDADRVMSHYAQDNVHFIVVPPFEFSEANTCNKRAVEAWFSSLDGPICFEVLDLTITTDRDTAFCYFLNHFSATSVRVGKFDVWHTVTLGLRNRDGRWLITVARSSLQFLKKPLK
jgi:ketosteroid isomerase-like protein